MVKARARFGWTVGYLSERWGSRPESQRSEQADLQLVPCHDVSILIASIGPCAMRGIEPRAKVSMMIMRPRSVAGERVVMIGGVGGLGLGLRDCEQLAGARDVVAQAA